MAKTGDYFFMRHGVEIPAKRLVCWIPEPLHRAIKSEAVLLGIEIGVVVASIVEEDFDEHGVMVDWPQPSDKVDAR